MLTTYSYALLLYKGRNTKHCCSSYLDLGEDEVEIRGGQLLADQLTILLESDRNVLL